MSILKQQVSSSPNFVSFFIIMTHNSPVNFQLIHFILWIKGSHQSSNFETCHFPNHKSVFLQILHQFSMLSNITLLYLFSSNIIYFGQKVPIKCNFLLLSSDQVKIHQILSFLKQQISFSSNFASLFSVMRQNCSVLFS